MDNTILEIRKTHADLIDLCSFIEKYDKGLKGKVAIKKTKKALSSIGRIISDLDSNTENKELFLLGCATLKLISAFKTLETIYKDVESYVLIPQQEKGAGFIFHSFKDATAASCFLDEMEEAHDLLTQTGLNSILVCLEKGMKEK